MKKLSIFCITAVAAIVLCSCGGGSSSSKATPTPTEDAKPAPTDFKMLSNETEFKKVYNMAIEKLGADAKHASEVTFRMNRESEDTGGNENGIDYLTVIVQYLHPKNKNKLQQYSYWSSSAEWEKTPTTVEVSPIGDPESFRLEDYLMDLSALSFDRVNKVVQDSYAKFRDDAKYTYQYVGCVTIEDHEIKVLVYGRLKSNGQVKYETNTVAL